MKQFFNIFKFEFLSYLKNKVFVGITLVIVLLAGGILSYPRITDMMADNSGVEINTSERDIVLLSNLSDIDEETALSIFNEALNDNKIELTNKSLEELKAAVDNGECSSAIIINSDSKYTYIVKNAGMFDFTGGIINDVMINLNRISKMQKAGLSSDDMNSILSVEVESEMILTGKDQTANFFYTYVLMFALYMAILLYGQFVAMSVASEKSSRAMELLITSAKTTNLMFGKVLASGFAGLMQLVLMLGSSFVFYNVNKTIWADNEIVNSIFNMPISIMLYAILFFILGYFIFSFLFGAVGSLVSKSEDLNTAIMPVTFIFIISFFIVMFSMGLGNIDTPLMIAASFIPFTAPMAMFVRIAMGNVQTYEIIISVIILIITTLGIGYLAAKIYRAGVLLYGNTPKLSNIIKIVKNTK